VEFVPSRVPGFKTVKKLISRILLPFIGSFISVSAVSRERFCGNFNIAREKVKVVHNGIPQHKSPNPEANERLKAVLGIGRGDFVIGTVSRLVRGKGIEVLIDAFWEISRKKKDIKLLIVGDGNQRQKLQDRAKSAGIESCVIFAGQKDDVFQLLNLMGIFVMPSLSEAMPFALIEAMSEGKAVVATDVGGVRELVENSEIGILVEPGDPGKVGAALELLMVDKGKMTRMGQNAKKQAENKFSLPIMINRTEEILDENLNKLPA
jgi:glycosyltransferase involved in cell wall biosynthesis